MKRISRHRMTVQALSFAALALSSLAAGCVDETGYEGDAGDAFVDETGYLKPDQVFYTASAGLDITRPIVVLGLPGAVSPPGGTLVVSGPGDPVLTGPDDDGAFRIELEAQAGDVLEFRYTPPGEDEGFDTLTLDDELRDVAAPGPPGTSSGPGLYSAPDVDDLVTVNFDALSSGAPPYIAFNLGGDDSGSLSDTGESVTVPAVA